MKKLIAHHRNVKCAFKFNDIYSTTVNIQPFKGNTKEFFTQNPAEDIPSGTIVYTKMSQKRLFKELSNVAVNKAVELAVDVQWADGDTDVTVFMQRQIGEEFYQFHSTISEFGLLLSPIFPFHNNVTTFHTHPLSTWRNKLLNPLNQILEQIKRSDFASEMSIEDLEPLIKDLKHIPIIAFLSLILPSEVDIFSLAGTISGGPIGPFTQAPIALKSTETPVHEKLEGDAITQFIYSDDFKSAFVHFLDTQTTTNAHYTEYMNQFQNIIWKSLKDEVSEELLKEFAETTSKVMKGRIIEKLLELLNQSKIAEENGLHFIQGINDEMALIPAHNPDIHPYKDYKSLPSLESTINQIRVKDWVENNPMKVFSMVVLIVILISSVSAVVVGPIFFHWMMKNGYGDYVNFER